MLLCVYVCRYHFQDLAESNGSTQEATKVFAVTPLSKDQLAMTECTCGWLLTGSQSVTKFNTSHKSTVKILLSTLRLPQYTTDVLVSFNCPTELGSDNDTDTFLSVVNSVELLNPSVFG